MKKVSIAVFFIVIFISGCAQMVVPPESEILALDFGQYPSNYEELVKAEAAQTLFDPYSAYFYFLGSPQKGYVQLPPLRGGKLFHGWSGFVEINAKNRMGAYVGKTKFRYVILNGRVTFFDEEKNMF